jgi:ubiquinone/menaquinone biosynthesis C-methylase UbiE
MELKLFHKTHHIPLNGLNVSRRLEFNLLMKYLNLRGDERLLDVACGDGFWTAKMIPRAKEVVGFDYNNHRLLQARRLAPGMRGAVRCDAHVLPFRDRSFDRIVGICVLEHFEDDVKALKELRRVLKDGGGMAMTVDSFSYPGMPQYEIEAHAKKFSVVHHYTVEILREKLSDAGFELREWTYLLRSPLSANLYRFALQHPKFAYFLYPVSYPLSFWSERFSRNQKNGNKLAFSAGAK